MEKHDPKLNIILACLDDVLDSLEKYSVENNDFCLDEVMTMRDTLESIKDSRWKIGVQNQ